VATLVVALLVAFVLGRISAPDGVPASKVAGLQKQIAQSRQQIGSLQSELADAQAAAQPSPQPAASAAPGTAAGGRGTTYEVKSGDTLNSIAVDFYGSSSFADYLAEANHLTHPGRLTVGQKLHIPPKP
jgi:nucleoid-associated protein YgaU